MESGKIREGSGEGQTWRKTSPGIVNCLNKSRLAHAVCFSPGASIHCGIREKPPEAKPNGLNSHLTLTLTSHITLSKAILVILGLSFLICKVRKGIEGLRPHQ